jgi:hypothetical protein
MFMFYDVKPGPSSQTSSVEIENIRGIDVDLSFFDAHSPSIQNPTKTWEEEAEQVLEEHAELWERLSKL